MSDKKPVLLSGGNPQIAKGYGDAPVNAYIAAMPGWKSDVGRRLDALIEHAVPISHCTDHVSQRSIYFNDPDGNRLEIYFEVPDALRRYAVEGRGDQDVPLEVTRPGEPLPAWLDEDWLARFEPVAVS